MAKAKFDLKTEAQRGLHAGVGAADLAIETVREYVAEAQKRFEGYQKDARKAFKELDFEPKALRNQATTVFSTRVEELSKDARARRESIEKRVAELQDDATDTFDDLVKRGEKVVKRFRKQTASVADPGPVAKDTGVTRTAKKAPAKRTTAQRTTAKKAPAKKAPAKKATTAS